MSERTCQNCKWFLTTDCLKCGEGNPHWESRIERTCQNCKNGGCTGEICQSNQYHDWTPKPDPLSVLEAWIPKHLHLDYCGREYVDPDEILFEISELRRKDK